MSSLNLLPILGNWENTVRGKKSRNIRVLQSRKSSRFFVAKRQINDNSSTIKKILVNEYNLLLANPISRIPLNIRKILSVVFGNVCVSNNVQKVSLQNLDL
jgi:hypothetical protein